ncbi:Tad domain-containing protein [Marinomonas fungiae]|uniref:Tad domain-containing protein n=1 Tax=Marinomonas fungiae TaxID=1137284 RepID=UPI003A945CD3
MRYLLKSKQAGHASILFILIFPALFGFFVWGVEGARIMQDRARLSDAVEVASLAVAAENSDVTVTQSATAKKFIEAYFPNNVNVVPPTVIKLSCEQNPKCDEDDPDQARFFEYQVSVSISQDAWFPNNEQLSYGDSNGKIEMASNSVSRKYQSQAVDVVLVSDYSSSMLQSWNGVRKYQGVNNIIGEIGLELKKFNEQNKNQTNRMAVIPFSYYTSKYIGNNRRYTTHLKCKNTCPKIPRSSDVKAKETVSNIFTDSSIHDYYYKGNQVNDSSFFWNIGFMTDFDALKSEVDRFNITGNYSLTASYTGLIEAARTLYSDHQNSRALIIILSDGIDWDSNITDKLLDENYCQVILNTLNGLTDSEGKNIKTKMAAIGFDYNVNANPQMKTCVGDDNVYEAKNTAEIKNKILELISEEIGHLAE